MTDLEDKEGALPAELAMHHRDPQPPKDLEKLFLEHQGRVYRAAYRVTGSASDAEDVLQTVFLRLVRREVPAAMDDVSSYLYRAAVNAALDVLRARRPSVPIEDVEDRLADRADPSARREEIRAALRAAVARLQPRWAEIFVLRYFEDYDNQEIARLLGISQATVGVTLFRIRHRLRKELTQTRGGR